MSFFQSFHERMAHENTFPKKSNEIFWFQQKSMVGVVYIYISYKHTVYIPKYGSLPYTTNFQKHGKIDVSLVKPSPFGCRSWPHLKWQRRSSIGRFYVNLKVSQQQRPPSTRPPENWGFSRWFFGCWEQFLRKMKNGNAPDWTAGVLRIWFPVVGCNLFHPGGRRAFVGGRGGVRVLSTCFWYFGWKGKTLI